MLLIDAQDQSWGEREQVTLRDVAKAAGVSTSTASVVLNAAKSGTRVSVATRRKVLEVAERMEYRPNALAQSLIRGRTHRIGVYSGGSRIDARNSFFAEVLGGICDAAAEFEANVVIHTSGSGDQHLLELVSNRAFDGLIVHARSDDPILPLLGELRVPAVSIADPVGELPCVVVDDENGGLLQAQHVASIGHRHVMLKVAPWPMESARIRMVAFQEAAQRLGIRVTPRLETFGEDDGLDAEDVRILSEGEDRATAVIGWSDHVASRICNRLTTLGISIPESVAVLGFDGFRHYAKPLHELTTIRAPWSAIGASATQVLMQLVDGKSVPKRTVLPVEFVRGSTT